MVIGNFIDASIISLQERKSYKRKIQTSEITTNTELMNSIHGGTSLPRSSKWILSETRSTQTHEDIWVGTWMNSKCDQKIRF